ncbi:MAG: hypothetical protein HYY16_00975 [Planctomycetes bacterium]|nr:hypothetical protein [Planctomycetota bacterium]
MGTWHTHTLPLNPAWGNIQVQFQFETIDEVDNDFAGWFIDDVRITATAPGGTTGGGGEGPNPGARLRDNSNGDKGINDLICPNAVPGSPAASAGLVAFLLAMAASLRRSH